MMSVYRATEIQNLLESAQVTGDELTEFLLDGQVELDIEKLAIEAIPELSQDFMDQYTEANEDRFGLSGFLSYYCVSDVLEEYSVSGEYDEVIEDVFNNIKIDVCDLESIYIERTTTGWTLYHGGSKVDIPILKNNKKVIKKLEENIWTSVCGVYATWATLGHHKDHSIYPEGAKRTVYISKAYLKELFV